MKRKTPNSKAENRALTVLANAGLIPHEYSTVCYDCPNGKKTPAGTMQFYANQKAQAHAVRKPGHTVYVLDYDVPVGKRLHEPSVLPMADTSREEPGF